MVTEPRFILHVKRRRAISLAEIAEHAKRYSGSAHPHPPLGVGELTWGTTEMEEGIKGAVMLGVELTAEERDLLARAYEHQVTRMRKSWSRIAACEERERRSAERCGARLGHVVKYRLTLESEIRNLCSDLFTLLEVHLIPHAGTSEALVFFLKMYIFSSLCLQRHKEIDKSSLLRHFHPFQEGELSWALGGFGK